MTAEAFVKQLDGCTYLVDGKPSGGYNCVAATEAMFLYRASQGKIKVSSCTVRKLTNDTKGGLRLSQAKAVSEHYGITGGALWLPGSFAKFRELMLTGRYGAHLQMGYAPIANTDYDCFGGLFRKGHDGFVSKGTANYARWGDPGADGRRPTIPDGWQDIPWELLEKAADALPVKVDPVTGKTIATLAQEYGSGHVFAYLTPPDPIVTAPHYKATVTKQTKLWNDQTRRWVYTLKPGATLYVRGARYTKGGVSCYPVTGPTPYVGYFVPTGNVRLSK